ncbi:MAG TPA: zinc-dependent metalloprotease family protein [Thermoanaerobaculia bacterium]|nr:zinc-dependent metalloprotease family protein [Thermoanaerobaculia bacterium]
MNRWFRISLKLLTIAALSSATAAHAAEPSSGTVSKGNRTSNWLGGPHTASAPSPAGCVSVSNPACDAFALTVDLKPGSRFAVAIASEIEGDDYDLYVYYPDGTAAASSATEGGNEAVVIQHTLLHGSGPYQVRVLPFTVTPGSTYQGLARGTRDAAIEAEDPNACLEATPAAIGISGITDNGQTVSLDVTVLLDGVSLGVGNQIMTKAAEAYAPVGIDLNVVSYQSVTFTGTEGAALIQQAKNRFGGVRPAGSDLVYVLSNKDLTTDGDTSLAGLADCIGGVRFAHHAFAVGEAVGIEESAIGPFLMEVDAHPEIAAHELGHLMGAHHHYANCVEGNLQGAANDLSPCSLMFNFVDFQSLNFAQLNAAVVRGHAVQHASP